MEPQKDIRRKKAWLVNGIQTEKDEAMNLAERLGIMTGLWVNSYYNPADLFVVDLAECAWSRVLFFKPRSITRRLAVEVRWHLERTPKEEPAYIFAHSQGCMVVMNAMRLLSLEHRARIRVFLFADTNLYEADGLARCEYFRNEDDVVVANLVLGQIAERLVRYAMTLFLGEFKPKGPLYIRRGSGHSLGKAYLDNLREFSGYTESWLYKLQQGERP